MTEPVITLAAAMITQWEAGEEQAVAERAAGCSREELEDLAIVLLMLRNVPFPRTRSAAVKESSTDPLYAEKIAAAGLAAYYCSRPEIWDDFTGWGLSEGLLDGSADMTVMRAASAEIFRLLRDARIGLLQAALDELELS